jgi:hypothetical protein
MASLSDSTINKLIDFYFRGVTVTPPTTLYAALFTVAPTKAGGGTEVAGGSYARVGLACTATNWAATNAAGSTASPSTGTSDQTSNNAAITFPTSTASWGTIVACGLYDAATGGNLVSFGSLSATIGSGVTPSFAAAALVQSFS